MITFEAVRLLAALAKIEAACDALPEIAEKVRSEALGFLIISTNLNVYSTAPGKYQRTGELLQGLNASAASSKNRASVTAVSAANYALYVETGRGFKLESIQAIARESANPLQPQSFGRSGTQWFLPAPIVTGAQAFAVYRLQQLFGEKVRAALK